MLKVGPESSALTEVVEAFQRRSRALKHKNGVLTGKAVWEQSSDTDLEKLELEWSRNRTCVRMFVWSDRWTWIDARASSKAGWQWEWTRDGRALGDDFAVQLEAAFEESIMATYGRLPSIRKDLDVIWQPLLAQGPVERR